MAGGPCVSANLMQMDEKTSRWHSCLVTTSPVPVGNLIRLVREAESRNASVS